MAFDTKITFDIKNFGNNFIEFANDHAICWDTVNITPPSSAGIKTMAFSINKLFDITNYRLCVSISPQGNCNNISRFWASDMSGNNPYFNSGDLTYINISVDFKYVSYPAIFNYIVIGKLL